MDLKTLLITATVVSFCLLMVACLAYRWDRAYPGLREWVLYSVFLTAGLGCYATRGKFGQFFYSVSGNTAIIVSLVFLLWGLKKFHGLDKPGIFFVGWLPALFSVPFTLYTTYAAPNPQLRIIVFSLISACLFFYTALFPYRAGIKKGLGQKLLTVSLIVMGLFSLARIPLVIYDEPPYGNLAGTMTAAYLLLIVLLSVMTAVALLTLAYEKSEAALKKERERLEIRVQERTRELEDTHKRLIHAEKLNALGKLAAEVAHEINSPICGIALTLTDLRNSGWLPEEEKKLVETGINECARITKLINNLSQSTKKSTGVMVNFNLAELIDSVILLNRRALKKRGIEIINMASGGAVALTADADQINQVLTNLIQNAAEAIKPGEGGQIVIQAANGGGMVMLTVSDNGTGIAPSDEEKLFEPFYSTKTEGPGMGLGLSISRQIILNHGGEIKAEPNPEGGTIVRVVLPAPATIKTLPGEGAAKGHAA